MQIEEALKLAKGIARRMSRDPEAEGLAVEAVAYLYRQNKQDVPMEAQVRVCTRHSVWCWWRSLRVRPKLETGHIEDEQEPVLRHAERPAHDSELAIGPYDWVLLHERHIEKLPLDSLARDRGVTVSQVRRMIQQAEDRFIIAMLLQEE